MAIPQELLKIVCLYQMDIPSGVPYIICAVTKILNIFCIVRVRLVHVITLTFINATVKFQNGVVTIFIFGG